jgi:hypothetical protein
MTNNKPMTATEENIDEGFDDEFYWQHPESIPDQPIGEDLRPKDRVKRGLSSACIEENWDCRKGGDV